MLLRQPSTESAGGAAAVGFPELKRKEEAKQSDFVLSVGLFSVGLLVLLPLAVLLLVVLPNSLPALEPEEHVLLLSTVTRNQAPLNNFATDTYNREWPRPKRGQSSSDFMQLYRTYAELLCCCLPFCHPCLFSIFLCFRVCEKHPGSLRGSG